MSDLARDLLSLDLPAMLTGTLAAVTCGLLGNLLVLRRQSLLGDAISHSVLPGLVLAFMWWETRAALPMFVGAAIAGMATVTLIAVVRRLGRVESGAAMGVVFSAFFALGVLLIEQHARAVDLDPDCVLNGNLELIFLARDVDVASAGPLDLVRALPRELWTLAIMLLVTITTLVLFAKELRIAAFDPGLAATLGFRPGAVNYAYLILISMAVVASFEAVGSILVISMLICPAATARHLTDRYRTQFVLSGAIALVTGVLGYVAGAFGPIWLGAEKSVTAAGMMTVVGGFLLVVAIVLAPAHGLVARRWRHRRLARSVAREDLLGLLYRAEEAGDEEWTPARLLAALGDTRTARRALDAARRDGLAADRGERVALTASGRRRARSVVRLHRLWESYLVDRLGIRPDHVHDIAMQLEHVTDPDMHRRLGESVAGVEVDPHDRPIPSRHPDSEDRP